MSRSAWAWLVGSIAVVLAAPWMGGAPDDFIFWQLRVPRVIMGAVVGALLALSGAVYQCLFDNPLATPSTVGTTGGAALGALAATILLGPATVLGLPLTIPAAFAGALLVTAVVGAVAYSGRARVNDVLLAGIAISLASSALASGLKFSGDLARTVQAVHWSLGNLAQVGYERVLVLIPLAVLSSLGMLSLTGELAALAAGEDKAFSQGVNVRRVRVLGLVSGSLALGASVAMAGPIAFVGLIVPHLVRKLISARRDIMLPASMVVGAAFLVVCDALARTAWGERELPVGVLTAAIGAPLVVWIVMRRDP